MIPKEKAEKLWRKFANADLYIEGKHATYQGLIFSHAIICALIVADETEKALQITGDVSWKYWHEVKTELEAMK